MRNTFEAFTSLETNLTELATIKGDNNADTTPKNSIVITEDIMDGRLLDIRP